MANADMFKLTIDGDALNLVGGTKAVISVKRRKDSTMFSVVPEYAKIIVPLSNSLGEVYLPTNSYGTVYECVISNSAKESLSHFYFRVLEADLLLSDAIKYTAYPEIREPERYYELVSSTEDPYPTLHFGSYVATRNATFSTQYLLNIAKCTDGESASINIKKNGLIVGTCSIDSAGESVFLLNNGQFDLARGDVLRYEIESVSLDCETVYITMVGYFFDYDFLEVSDADRGII